MEGEHGTVGALGGGPANRTAPGEAGGAMPPSCLASGEQPEPSTGQLLSKGVDTTGEACCRGVLSGPVADTTSGSSAVAMECTGGPASGDVEGSGAGLRCKSQVSSAVRIIPKYTVVGLRVEEAPPL